jgi:hypothetical protein
MTTAGVWGAMIKTAAESPVEAQYERRNEQVKETRELHNHHQGIRILEVESGHRGTPLVGLWLAGQKGDDVPQSLSADETVTKLLDWGKYTKFWYILTLSALAHFDPSSAPQHQH